MAQRQNVDEIRVGSKVTVFARFLHPAQYVQDNIIQGDINCQLSGLEVQQIDTRTINKRRQLAIIVTHPQYVNKNGAPVELYGCIRWFSLSVLDVPDSDGSKGGDEDPSGTESKEEAKENPPVPDDPLEGVLLPNLPPVVNKQALAELIGTDVVGVDDNN